MNRRKLKPILFVLLVPALSAGTDGNIALSATAHDGKTGLIIHFPESWKIDREAEVFTVVSFPPELRPRLVLVPMGQAEIVIMPPPPGINSVRDWMHFDRIHKMSETEITEVAVDTSHFGKLTSTRVREKLEVFGSGWSDEYFFNLAGHLFKARLFYRSRGRNDSFEDLLRAVIASIEFR